MTNDKSFVAGVMKRALERRNRKRDEHIRTFSKRTGLSLTACAQLVGRYEAGEPYGTYSAYGQRRNGHMHLARLAVYLEVNGFGENHNLIKVLRADYPGFTYPYQE